MSGRIEMGDLVWIAYPMKCCGKKPKSVKIFQVSGIHYSKYSKCNLCGNLCNDPTDFAEIPAIIFADGRKYHMPLYTLEKFKGFPESELIEESDVAKKKGFLPA